MSAITPKQFRRDYDGLKAAGQLEEWLSNPRLHPRSRGTFLALKWIEEIKDRVTKR